MNPDQSSSAEISLLLYWRLADEPDVGETRMEVKIKRTDDLMERAAMSVLEELFETERAGCVMVGDRRVDGSYKLVGVSVGFRGKIGKELTFKALMEAYEMSLGGVLYFSVASDGASSKVSEGREDQAEEPEASGSSDDDVYISDSADDDELRPPRKAARKGSAGYQCLTACGFTVDPTTHARDLFSHMLLLRAPKENSTEMEVFQCCVFGGISCGCRRDPNGYRLYHPSIVKWLEQLGSPDASPRGKCLGLWFPAIQERLWTSFFKGSSVEQAVRSTRGPSRFPFVVMSVNKQLLKDEQYVLSGRLDLAFHSRSCPSLSPASDPRWADDRTCKELLCCQQCLSLLRHEYVVKALTSYWLSPDYLKILRKPKQEGNRI